MSFAYLSGTARSLREERCSLTCFMSCHIYGFRDLDVTPNGVRRINAYRNTHFSFHEASIRKSNLSTVLVAVMGESKYVRM